ncbi:thermonuclease family protein [Pseudoroseomonas globiformis]|uniref:Thermonuclease family protein n=1 Tax=Teichococcus globiformis TaxID=2307229 RepID=A0ABV7FTD8_9PROT
MNRKAWLAAAIAAIGLLGAEQVTQGDLLRLVRNLFRAVEQEQRRLPNTDEDFSGLARVLDGDTFDVGGVRVRMQGIDALETEQSCNRRQGGRFACGEEATRALTELIGGRPVTCEPDGSQTYGRVVANCFVPRQGGGRVDLSEGMVRSGFAFDCPRFSNGRYAGVEAEARAAGRGAWAGRFQYPWSFRDRAGACGR